MTLQLLFNPINKEFIGFAANGQEHINSSNLLIKEIELDSESFNLARYVWDGDYDSGQLVDLNLGPAIVLETDVEFKNYDIFARRLNIDVYALEKICKMTFDEFQNFIVMRNKINDKIEKEKIFFKNSRIHKFVPREDVRKVLEKTLKI